jgi:tetratricopeptide (TPR) repeat protein
MAEVDGRQGRLARAAEGYERAARAYEALGMRATAATIWLDTATCWYEQGRFDDAVARIGAIYDALPPFGRARADNALGNVARRRGDLAEAERAYLAAREAFRREGSRYAEAVTVQNLGAVARMRGDLPAAERLVREAITLHEETGRVRPQADALLTLGNVLLARGDLASAADAYRRCASLGAAASDEKLVLAANVNLGGVELEAGRPERAVAQLEAAREASSRLGDRGVTVAIASVLGLAMAVAGDPRAVGTVAGALDAALAAKVRPELMRILVAAGHLWPDLAEAAWLHVAADPATTPTDRARARAALGPKPRAVAAIPEDELLAAILERLGPATSSRTA